MADFADSAGCAGQGGENDQWLMTIHERMWSIEARMQDWPTGTLAIRIFELHS